ncbi:hypothetical protein AB0B25_07995 [Nocardia sp. NPDC049190]|uniref:hypothetical protein n=1 Tax=Nocardia sp. NPDC049190 TaxID=3155650 RepID=UPI0033C23FD7
MTRTTFLTTMIALAAVTSGCATNTPSPTASAEQHCRATSFVPSFGEVDSCSVEAVLTVAVSAVFSYRPSDSADQRGSFRAARPLMDSRFAEHAEYAALVWAPVSATQWQQWRTNVTTITAAARVTSDDHPADTATAASRVLAIELEPSDQPPISWAVYTRATRANAASAWLLSGMEVLS